MIDGTGRLVAPVLIDSHAQPSRYVVGGLPCHPATRSELLAGGGQVETFVAELSAINAACPDPELIYAATLLASQSGSGATPPASPSRCLTCCAPP